MDEKTLKDIESDLRAIAEALTELAKCVDDSNGRLGIEGEVGAYEESPY